MTEIDEEWPEEGDLLICTVKDIKQNGAYLGLDSYEGREGFVFVGEIAAGWVRNIRAHVREGQRVVAKVIQVKKDRKRVELSLKSVSEERRRDTVQAWKNEERANQIMRVASERVGWDDNKSTEISNSMIETFGTLYGALEECAISESALTDAGFEGDWTDVVTSLAMENIIPPFVEIRGVLEIQVWGEEGVYAIRDALLDAEACAEGLEEVTLSCHYDGAPNYRIDIRAPDYQAAESVWESAVDAVKKSMSTVDGSLSIDRT
ncbi:MAG: translation initiation factor IF-2 subunit alpha [Euryarchaeota archaeon]|jgi:translation initiation factor 2 subunit 1|nr:translation initiation factor IF-2 subunit alpha [Euryarchaeota archaeon]MBT86812.1 translation initiation factor IF-2 subunit alpha [Euryarchaeota archaeon]DAC47624.1 MAG TPA: translation initiation factor IF-2 subunit alpha [Candidatus Poseidoniales archaeon]HII33534.1 translation initiation factor IF-2 subunit alpha [Candidatus Thalassarchaeaceae archaeon]|tara:strand:- start:3048 stop:3836 length:789 start_codon:yes stop_codon:yes gene_type:complete